MGPNQGRRTSWILSYSPAGGVLRSVRSGARYLSGDKDNGCAPYGGGLENDDAVI